MTQRPIDILSERFRLWLHERREHTPDLKFGSVINDSDIFRAEWQTSLLKQKVSALQPKQPERAE